MGDWLKRLVSDGNVIRDRSYTNWNTLDVAAIVAEKQRELQNRELVRTASEATVDTKKK